MEQLSRAIERTADEIKPIVQTAAVTATSLLKKRIINEGFGRKYRSRSYIELRKSKNLQVNFVNLSFSGRMFKGLNVSGSFREGNKVFGYVAGTDDETKYKLRENKKRFPEFTNLSEQENEIIIDQYLTPKIIEIFNKNLGL